MKRFLFKAVGFTIGSVLVTALLIVLCNYWLNEQKLFQLDKNVRYLIVGDSHPECAYNDSLITGVSNFGASGESYFYTYQKLKRLIESNKQISTVLIEYNNGQIEKGMDECIWGDQYINSSYPKFSVSMGYQDYKLLFSHNWRATIEAQSISLKNNLGAIFRERPSPFWDRHWGGYLFLKNEKANLDQFANDVISESDELIAISDTNISYLLKIVDWCKRHHIQIYLIRTPVHAKYRGRVNEKTFQKILREQLSGLEFLDFKDFPATNSEFADLHHLDYKGATRFSVFFDKLMKKGLFETSDKQQMINEGLDKLNGNP